MRITLSDGKDELGRRAARDGALLIRKSLRERGRARIIVATGASQFEMLSHLVSEKDLDWRKVVAFHLDEYIGLGKEHPASFRKYLKDRFTSKVPLGVFHEVNGDAEPREECRRLGALIGEAPVDVAFIGIGENGHLAFNDPPANFETEEPYLVVNLDEACRRQQMGEGWFKTLAEVPKTAISMGIRQILKAGSLIASVPDLRKAKAVHEALEGPVSPRVPASILQQHPDVTLYLDHDSASLLKRKPSG